MATLISGSTGVNKIQDGTITNADIASSAAIAGAKLIMPAGTVLQVVTGRDTASAILGSSNHTLINCPITPIQSNSKFFLLATITHGIPAQTNNDSYDIGLFFTRSGVSMGGNPNANRRQVTSGDGALYCTDVPMSLEGNGTNYESKYDTLTRTFNHIDSPSVAAGTAIPYKVMVYAQTSYYRNRSLANASSGGQSSMIVMEVAT